VSCQNQGAQGSAGEGVERRRRHQCHSGSGGKLVEPVEHKLDGPLLATDIDVVGCAAIAALAIGSHGSTNEPAAFTTVRTSPQTDSMRGRNAQFRHLDSDAPGDWGCDTVEFVAVAPDARHGVPGLAPY
jgi:hypothetical protein